MKNSLKNLIWHEEKGNYMKIDEKAGFVCELLLIFVTIFFVLPYLLLSIFYGDKYKVVSSCVTIYDFVVNFILDIFMPSWKPL